MMIQTMVMISIALAFAFAFASSSSASSSSSFSSLLSIARWRFEAHWTAIELASTINKQPPSSFQSSSCKGWFLYAPYRGRLGNQIESLLEAAKVSLDLGRALVLPVVAQTHDMRLDWQSGSFADLFNISVLQRSAACRACAGCWTADEYQQRNGRRLSQIVHLASRPFNDWHYRQARYELSGARTVSLEVEQHPRDGGAALLRQLRDMSNEDVLAVTEFWKYVRVSDAHVADVVEHLQFRDAFLDAAARFREQNRLCDVRDSDGDSSGAIVAACSPFVAVHLRLGSPAPGSRNNATFDWQWWCEKQDSARAVDFHGAMVASGQSVDAKRCLPSAQHIGDTLRHHRRRFDVLFIASDSEKLPDDIDSAIKALRFERVLRANDRTFSQHYFGPLVLDMLVCESAHMFIANDYSTASRFVVDRRRSRGLWSDRF
jgi:hypothetical protein